ncbi:MAG TPA: TIGR03089 family protein [Jatrophihabitans sp.]|jgi:uncharacterized protein (TIGR03089 family)|nr:TIGR03089 family protein [Jatrophihabitans sp.]
MTPEQQFDRLLAAAPSRPFVTYYDEASGERTELSVKSLANWVAKTHHLLGTELGLGVGDTALVALPAHWISVPVLLGCLTAGLALTPSGSADVAFVAPTTLADAAGAADVYAVAPDSAAAGFGAEPPGQTLDYVTSVRRQEDKWPTVYLAAAAADPCLPGLTRGEVAARAAQRDLEPAARVLTTRAWTSPDDWIDAVLAPVAAAGSLVIVANCDDEEVIAKRMSQERATLRLS